ncbi:MAG: C4-dicarboxylate ABC transporter substrate-binding protein, partial [Pseudorhizobium sp.]
MITRRNLMAGAAAASAMPAYLRSAWAQTPEVELKLHHFLGPKAPAQTRMLEPWAKAIQEESKGRIKIDIYPS